MFPNSDLPFYLHEIQSPHDPLLPAWMNLYNQAFPSNERIPPERMLEMIVRKHCGEFPGLRFQAFLEQRSLLGLLVSQRFDESGILYLWYLAMNPEHRCQGLGSLVYRQLTEQWTGVLRCILFDVEIPDLAATESDRQLRMRRINFYRRMGVRQLTGVHYTIKIDPDDEPLPMHLMIHPLQPLTGRQAYELALQVVDPGWLQAVCEPELV